MTEHRYRHSKAEARRRALLEGYSAFSTSELYEFLISEIERDRGVRPPQNNQNILESPSWTGADVRPLALQHLLGISSRAALILAGALELGSRGGPGLCGGELLTPETVFRWAEARLGHLPHEEVWTLGANARSQLRSVQQVGRGGVAGCSLLPRDVLGPLLREGASGFVLVHNHPSGDPEPSALDLEMTRELELLAVRLGVPLLDHVIVAKGRFTSLFQEGYLTTPRRQLGATSPPPAARSGRPPL